LCQQDQSSTIPIDTVEKIDDIFRTKTKYTMVEPIADMILQIDSAIHKKMIHAERMLGLFFFVRYFLSFRSPRETFHCEVA